MTGYVRYTLLCSVGLMFDCSPLQTLFFTHVPIISLFVLQHRKPLRTHSSTHLLSQLALSYTTIISIGIITTTITTTTITTALTLTLTLTLTFLLGNSEGRHER